ncbi:neutrophil defensin 4-like isoform X1 [Rhinopithecus roxellana]|uniref:neutrophil defensin 4-like isoform X1 n=1 Tax=Rhinopithecus roxellana TaxID=61622 RepID=UPI00123743D1|nr:neutrophil defensin 4-like isoform X1 [Rhinopithecus roxellana]XP_030793798.1 neutrophil defensin 4-like isoform X1 [Rhinopithecus roxellana]
MRSLTILAAILLFALLAQAKSLQETADDTATQEQPGEDDQDLAVSFEENGLSTLRASGSQARLACICRIGRCLRRESYYGRCGRNDTLCCRRAS